MRLAIFLITLPAMAQVSGRITGSINDPGGAPVPGARVQLFPERSTAAAARAESTSDGLFTIPSVPPGFYDLAVEAPSFARYTATGLKVDPAQDTVVPTIRLEIATVVDGIKLNINAPPFCSIDPDSFDVTIVED